MHINTCKRTSTHIGIKHPHTLTYALTHVHTNTQKDIVLKILFFLCTWMDTLKHICIYTHTYTQRDALIPPHTYTHAHIQVHKHTQLCTNTNSEIVLKSSFLIQMISK